MGTSADKLIELLLAEDDLIDALCTATPSEIGALAETLADLDDELDAIIFSLEPDALEVTIIQITVTETEPVSNQKEERKK